MTDRPLYRLSHTVWPSRYRLEIEPNLNESKFDGQVFIEVQVREAVSEIVINALELTLHEVRITAQDGSEFIGEVSYNAREEQVILTWPTVLAPGLFTLWIRYEGILGSTMSGFYRTQVPDRQGNPVVIAATQCEQTDARRIFPGWDEPEFKARFAITLIVPADQRAFSNGKELSNTLDQQGRRRVEFAETIPMSTYLVALVVGPYETTVPEMVGDIPVRIVARQGFAHLTDFAKQAAVDTLKYFQDYFGIPYPGDKLDHIAIPEFAAGAMENLGCVTYREELLLLDPNQSSPIEQSNAMSTIGHETAHMWFGDLVTMRWWNGIWLNEAFATFMELHATDALHPEWDSWTLFSHGRSLALAVDGLKNSRPIEYPVGRPVESWAMFDLLTYQKGASILRMLEQYLGEEVFRQSVVQYIRRHSMKNTEASDLWDALEEVSHEPVRSIMESWVLQAGYPLVLAQLTDDGQNLVLSQKQFRYESSGTGQWQVPVTVGVGISDGRVMTERHMLGSHPVSMVLPEDVAWVVVNRGGWGFYRVAYDEELSSRLPAALPSLTAIERYQMLDDVWAGVLAGEVPIRLAVQRWQALSDEEDPDVWGAVTPALSLINAIATDDQKELMAHLVRRLAGPLLARLGFQAIGTEDVRRSRLRGSIVRLLGTLGQDQEVIATARRRWHQHLSGQDRLAPELLTPVVHVVAESGDEKDWELMRQESKKATTPQDEQRYLFALARFKRPDLLKRTLDLYLSDSMRVQDGTIALGVLFGNRHAAGMTWDAIEAHWDRLLKRYPARTFEYFLMPLAQIMDEEVADRAIAWLKDHPIEEIERPIKQAIEFQGIHRAFKHRVKPHLSETLS